MKKLVIVYEKDHFTFNDKMYMQVDGVAMGSTLGPVLADIFIIDLKKGVLPELTNCIRYWKRYADDTIPFVKLGTIN